MSETLIKVLNKTGSIAVIPTDTVYGVVARAEDRQAVKKLYDLKNRENKPGTLIASSIKQLEELGFKHRYLKAVEEFWPGPISVIIPTSDPNLEYLTLKKMSLAVRVTNDINLINLLSQVGPILTSSANQPGETPAKNINEAKAYFGNKVDYYQDGGDIKDNKPSTIIKIIDDAIEVVRQGGIKIIDGKIAK